MKLLLKAAALPLLLFLTAVQWAGIFLTEISGVITEILSLLIAGIGTASLIFGLASAPEAAKMILSAFVIFLVPHIGGWMIGKIALLRCRIGEFLRS